MSSRRVVSILCAFVSIVVMTIPSAFAQPLGTFRWRLAPYCNVVTLDVVQHATTFTVSGSDDLCGAPVAAAASGTAHVNPNGSIGLSLLVTRPNGITLSSTVQLDVVTLSGAWADDGGNAGTFVFSPAAAPGEPRRITLKGVYSAGISIGPSAATLLSNFSFGRTLPVAPVAPPANIIPFGGAPTINCPGSFDNPRALPGQLCLYERFRTNVESYAVTDSSGVVPGVADTVGAHIYVVPGDLGATMSLTGVWAVTIP